MSQSQHAGLGRFRFSKLAGRMWLSFNVRQRMKIGEKITSVKRLKPGDLLAIPLEPGLFAFARIYRNARLGLFALRSSTLAAPEDLLKLTPEAFCGFFCMPKQRKELDW